MSITSCSFGHSRLLSPLTRLIRFALLKFHFSLISFHFMIVCFLFSLVYSLLLLRVFCLLFRFFRVFPLPNRMYSLCGGVFFAFRSQVLCWHIRLLAFVFSIFVRVLPRAFSLDRWMSRALARFRFSLVHFHFLIVRFRVRSCLLLYARIFPKRVTLFSKRVTLCNLQMFFLNKNNYLIVT